MVRLADLEMRSDSVEFLHHRLGMEIRLVLIRLITMAAKCHVPIRSVRVVASPTRAASLGLGCAFDF